MKKNTLRLFWLRFWLLRRFHVWKSWSGLGVVTYWPQKGWEEEVRTIFRRRHLRVVNGPCWSAGGAVVVMSWPKDDPQVQKSLAKDAPRLTADELEKSIEQIRGVKMYSGWKEGDVIS